MAMDGNVMKMREVDGVDLPPNSKVAMQPGDGYHIMLMGLKKPLAAGDKFPMTLRFEKAGKVDVSVKVEDQAAAQNKPDGMMGEHRMQH
jgi:copper(I)-binding protein